VPSPAHVNAAGDGFGVSAGGAWARSVITSDEIQSRIRSLDFPTV
jgi:hypothetical protein